MKNPEDSALFTGPVTKPTKISAVADKVIIKRDPMIGVLGSIILPDAAMPDTGEIISVGPKCKHLTDADVGSRAQVLDKLGSHIKINGTSYFFVTEKQMAGILTA